MNANSATETPAAAPETTTIETPTEKTAGKKAKKSVKKPTAKKQGKPVPRKVAKAAAPKASPKGTAVQREGSKASQIFALLKRKSGATLDELMAAAGWQRHSVRGFLSTARKRLRIKIEAARENGVTTYKMV